MHLALAETDAQIARCFPIMAQLRTHLKEEAFVARVRFQQEQGYQLAFAEDEGQIRCVAGFRIMENLVHGRHLYVDDLVTDQAQRSRGYGDALFDWLAARARQAGCTSLSLDSGVQRHAAHRFYLRKRMDIFSYRFHLKLD